MTWLLAVVLKPLGALLFFGFAAFVAHYLIRPLIPNGRIKTVLYDRSIKRNHPWKFAILGLIACYGVLGLVAYLVTG